MSPSDSSLGSPKDGSLPSQNEDDYGDGSSRLKLGMRKTHLLSSNGNGASNAITHTEAGRVGSFLKPGVVQPSGVGTPPSMLALRGRSEADRGDG